MKWLFRKGSDVSGMKEDKNPGNFSETVTVMMGAKWQERSLELLGSWKGMVPGLMTKMTGHLGRLFSSALQSVGKRVG